MCIGTLLTKQGIVRGCLDRYSSVLRWINGYRNHHIHLRHEACKFVRVHLLCLQNPFSSTTTSRTALYLCTASLLLFIAAILDLGRLFIRGPRQVSSNVDLNVVTGFIVSREVGLGLSYGFLYLFVWKAVAQCPDSERRKLGRQSQPHSASWARWGFVGTVLKWSTLLLIVLIPLLQIVWRIVDAQRRYGNIYIAESTLEIVASTIFILKICLNVLVSPSTSWWIPFKSYLGLVLGLIITAAMGVGNLVTCMRISSVVLVSSKLTSYRYSCLLRNSAGSLPSRYQRLHSPSLQPHQNFPKTHRCPGARR